jgi:NAD+ diphosphatase
MTMLGSQDLAIYGGARSLVDWHARHRFCARCGHATVLAKGGWQRSCTNAACKAEHFPRVDPVTIMLVEHQGNLLLGRQPRFPRAAFGAGRVRGAGQIDRGARWRAKCRRKRAWSCAM